MTTRILLLATLFGAVACANGPSEQDWKEGIRSYLAEDYRHAETLFERAVERAPDNSKYHLWLGLAIGRRAEGMTGLRRLGAMSLAKRVKRQFELAAELDGSNLKALEALHHFHVEAPSIAGGSKAEARNVARRIEQVDEARGAAALAAYYESVGDYERAGEQHVRACDLDPNDVSHSIGHASFLSRRGMHARSDEIFDAAFARAPSSPELWLAAAKAWVRAKRRSLYPRARKLLERYLDTPDRPLNLDPPSQVRKLLGRL